MRELFKNPSIILIISIFLTAIFLHLISVKLGINNRRKKPSINKRFVSERHDIDSLIISQTINKQVYFKNSYSYKQRKHRHNRKKERIVGKNV